MSSYDEDGARALNRSVFKEYVEGEKSVRPVVSGGFVRMPVVQYRALQGGWKKKKLSGNDKLSGLGDTRVNNCTVLIFNYLILFS